MAITSYSHAAAGIENVVSNPFPLSGWLLLLVDSIVIHNGVLL